MFVNKFLWSHFHGNYYTESSRKLYYVQFVVKRNKAYFRFSASSCLKGTSEFFCCRSFPSNVFLFFGVIGKKKYWNAKREILPFVNCDFNDNTSWVRKILFSTMTSIMTSYFTRPLPKTNTSVISRAVNMAVLTKAKKDDAFLSEKFSLIFFC